MRTFSCGVAFAGALAASSTTGCESKPPPPVEPGMTRIGGSDVLVALPAGVSLRKHETGWRADGPDSDTQVFILLAESPTRFDQERDVIRALGASEIEIVRLDSGLEVMSYVMNAGSPEQPSPRHMVWSQLPGPRDTVADCHAYSPDPASPFPGICRTLRRARK